MVKRIIENNLTILSCKEIVNELNDVLRRPKIRKFISEKEVLEILIIHKKITSFYKTTLKSLYFRDKSDNFLITLCKQGNAEYLVSGDKDVLESGIKAPPKIISKLRFEKLFL